MLTLAGSARRRAYPPVRVSRRVRVPEHDLVEIDCLGLRAPVTINAEPRLCVDEGRAIAAGAIVAIGHGSLVAAAERAVEPNIDPAAGVMGGIEAHLHRGPALPRQVAPTDLRARHHRRWGARCAGGHLREETHALAERPRLDLEEGCASIAGHSGTETATVAGLRLEAAPRATPRQALRRKCRHPLGRRLRPATGGKPQAFKRRRQRARQREQLAALLPGKPRQPVDRGLGRFELLLGLADFAGALDAIVN